MADFKYAGEFIIEECTLCTVGGLELDLKEQFSNISIFEDIYSNSITGSISFTDTNNLTANASIVGQEKLRLVIMTPNADDDTDRSICINFTDSPLHVYQVANNVNINDDDAAATQARRDSTAEWDLEALGEPELARTTTPLV